MLHQRLTRNLFTGQDEPLTAPLTRDFTEDLGDGRAETFFNKFGGAAAAYSLRALGSYNENVVRVRRESDNTEKDFTAIDVAGGAMARWVNEQPTLPLDLRELDTNTGERDGALIEAAAAYSLRKLKEDFTGDVVQVRRNVDGETEGFTADEVTDGTLEDFAKTGEVIFDSDFSAGTGGVLQDSGSGTTEITGNNDGISDGTASKDDVLKVENIQRVTPQIRIVDAPENTYRGSNKGSVTFTYYVPTGSAIIGKYWQIGSFRGSAGILSSSGVQIVGGAWTTASLSYDNKKPLSTFLTVTDQEVTDTESATFAEAEAGDAYYISKIKAYSYEELGLPLDQATGAAAAYSLRNLSSSYTGDVVEVRRSSDTAKEGFTAAEVTDGTLEAWVSADAPISPIADLNVDITDHTTGDTGTYSFGVNDILVDGATGNDNTGDGSESSPYATIAKGLAEVTSGNTVWVKGGTYAENTVGGYLLVNNLSFAAETTLRAVPSETVVLTNVSGLYIFRTNTTIDNFTFRGITFRNESPVTYSIYLSKDSNNFKIQDCRFEAQGSVTYAIRDNGSVSGSTSTTITNTAFSGAIQGIQALNTVGITLTDNYFQTTESGPTFANLRSGCGGTISITGNRLNGQIGTSGNSFDVAGTSLEISDNRINISDNNQDAISVRGGTSTNPITIDLQDNLIEAQDVGVVFYNYISSGTISGNKIHAGKSQVGGKTGLGIPVDGVTPVTALVQSLTVTNNEVRSDSGHAFLMSLNSANHTVTNNKFDSSQGGDHACVIKGDGHTLTGNKSFGGTRTAYYLKGATNITTTNHVGVQSVAAGNCIEVSPDDATTPDTVTSDCSTTGSTFIATNGDLYTISPSDLTAANVVFNSNCLIVKDSGSWGSLNGTTVTSLATVRTAWDSYITTNDENSYDTVNGTVSTWYDQSGSDNDAVQTTPANQPKIVDGGTLVTGGIDFDGTQFFGANGIASSVTGTDQPYSTFAVSKTNTTATQYLLGMGRAATSTPIKNILYHSGGNFGVQQRDDANTLKQNLSASAYSTGTTYLTSTTSSGTVIDFSKNSSLDLDDFDVDVGLLTIDKVNIGARANGDANPLNGSISELIIYNSDQSTKRRAIEENIANQYGISLAAFSRDGTVSTWYDQSGNTNDATQTDPTKQPKIVEGGSLVTGGIDFDGTDDFFDLDLGADLAQPNSFFMVQTSDTTNSAFNEFFDTTSGTPRTLLDQNAGYRLTAGVNLEDASFTAETNRVLFSAFANSTSSFICKNGASSAVGDAGTEGVNQFSSIARSFDRYYDGKMDEFIIYNSDQSSNRTAIEANIGETYGITDIPAADDTVNGFVQTWYDQSGEGRNGEQDTAANQPKIVVNGVLQKDTDGNPYLKFEGSQYLKVYKNGSLSGGLILPDVQNTFSVSVSSSTTAIDKFVCQANRSQDRYYLYNNKITIGDSQTVRDDPTINTKNVRSITSNVLGSFSLYLNSSLIGTKSYTGSATGGDSTIGATYNGASGHEGSIYELVFYRTDQSSNRPAIEANIANQYGITLS